MKVLITGASGFVGSHVARLLIAEGCEVHALVRENGEQWRIQDIRLFVTLYAKSTDKMPRQHTSNPKIPKVSKAIGSPFY
ncbi:MAG: NAD-dependent epimerase/dehydratase family protein [Microcystis aeruginosa K13-07]|nr:NAD-dependent epimerase/dehydratase family protein [Microcystis aeruginosa K13-07]